MARSKTQKLASQLPRSVEMSTRRVIKVGRNQPCPCGSGKKYKECHQSEGEAFLHKLARKQERERIQEEQKRAGVPWFKRFLSQILD